jgi:hypothetical protein
MRRIINTIAFLLGWFIAVCCLAPYCHADGLWSCETTYESSFWNATDISGSSTKIVSDTVKTVQNYSCSEAENGVGYVCDRHDQQCVRVQFECTPTWQDGVCVDPCNPDNYATGSDAVALCGNGNYPQNGVQDDWETGIDCGGETGIECVPLVPSHYTRYGEEVVLEVDPVSYDSSGNPVCPPGAQETNSGRCGYTNSAADLKYGSEIYTQEQIDAVYDVPDPGDYGVIPINVDGIGDESSTTQTDGQSVTQSNTDYIYDPSNDFVQLPDGTWVNRQPDGTYTDPDGSFVSISNPSTITQNPDGTTTQTQSTTTHGSNASGNFTRTDTTKNTYDSSGNLIKSETTSNYTGSPEASASDKISRGQGRGSDGSLTGDQFSKGIDQLKKSIDASRKSPTLVNIDTGGIEERLDKLVKNEGASDPLESLQADMQTALDEHGEGSVEDATTEALEEVGKVQFDKLPAQNGLEQQVLSALPDHSSQFEPFCFTLPNEYEFCMGAEASERIKQMLSWIMYVYTLMYCYQITVMAESRDT